MRIDENNGIDISNRGIDACRSLMQCIIIYYEKQNNYTSTILHQTHILTSPSFFHSMRNCSAFQYII